MGLDQGPSKLAVLQIAVASSLPFLPALSEDLVFDDLPAVARNKDLSASTPVPIFMGSIKTCDFLNVCSPGRPLCTEQLFAKFL